MEDNRNRKRKHDDDNNNELPHFLIVGAQKAGTMAAVENLNKHPDVYVVKEDHYFDRGWVTRPLSSYRSLFTKSSKKVQGEKTPEYIYVDACAERIKQVCSPNIKFILFLRNPVKRAYSAWNMNKERHIEEYTFAECVENNMNNLNEYRSYGTAEYHYIQRGFYYDQILRFLTVFPDRSKLLILIAEHVRKDPITQYNRIYTFLGVPLIYDINYEDEHVGTYKKQMSNAMENKLYKFYKPYNQKLFDFLGYNIPEWDQHYKPPPPPPPVIVSKKILSVVDTTSTTTTNSTNCMITTTAINSIIDNNATTTTTTIAASESNNNNSQTATATTETISDTINDIMIYTDINTTTTTITFGTTTTIESCNATTTSTSNNTDCNSNNDNNNNNNNKDITNDSSGGVMISTSISSTSSSSSSAAATI